MANVTSEHEAGDVSLATTLEVAEELERSQKDQGRLQDEATGVKLCISFREACNKRATHEVISVEAKKALHRTLKLSARPRR